MFTELAPALGLVVEAVRGIAEFTTKSRVASKRRFLRQLAELFNIFEDVETEVAQINHNLQAFLDEQHVGMRVHYIHTAGFHLDNFGETQLGFFTWMRKNEDIRQMIEVFSAEEASSAFLRAFRKLVGAHGRAREVIPAIVTTRNRLQAVRSPDPAKFPAPETVQEVIGQLNTLCSEIELAKKSISHFVCTNFDIQDLFELGFR